MEHKEWIVALDDAGTRLDVAAARSMGVSRSRAARMIGNGRLLLDGRPAAASRILRGGEHIVLADDAGPVARSTDAPLERDAPESELLVVYEDAFILVVNKPRGVVVHPSAGHESGTLVHAIIAHTDDLSGIGGEGRPGIVHRLDKDTTGLLAIAKNDEAHRSLQDQIQARTAVRVYRGIVWGSPRFDRATIEASVGRHPTDRKRMTVLPDGAPGARHAVTHLTVAARRGPFAEIEARLETGRTHQIRVHCSYIGHPVVADTTYGGDRRWPSGHAVAQERQVADAIGQMGGQALHAARLAFTHPATGEPLDFSAPLPADFDHLLATMRAAYP